MELGSNIKRIRKKWGMDQEEFASIFQLSRGAISMYETEASEPKLKWLLLFYEMTGIDIYTICTRALKKDEIPPQPFPLGTIHSIFDSSHIEDEVNELKEMLKIISERIEKIDKSP